MNKHQELRDKLENILRDQFVDKGYYSDGSTGWGIYESIDEILETVAKFMPKPNNVLCGCGDEVVEILGGKTK